MTSSFPSLETQLIGGKEVNPLKPDVNRAFTASVRDLRGDSQFEQLLRDDDGIIKLLGDNTVVRIQYLPDGKMYREYALPQSSGQYIPLTAEQMRVRVEQLDDSDPDKARYANILDHQKKGGNLERLAVAWTELLGPHGEHQGYFPVFKPKVTFQDSFKAQMKSGFPAAVPQGVSEAIHSKGLSTELMEQYARVVQALPKEKQQEALKKVQAIYAAGRFADVGIVALDAVWRIVMIALAESSGKPFHAMPHLRDIATVGIRGIGAAIEAKTRAKYQPKPPMPEIPQPPNTEPLPVIEHIKQQQDSPTKETLKQELLLVGQADARGQLETMAKA